MYAAKRRCACGGGRAAFGAYSMCAAKIITVCVGGGRSE